jgi:hypothetical protein
LDEAEADSLLGAADVAPPLGASEDAWPLGAAELPSLEEAAVDELGEEVETSSSDPLSLTMVQDVSKRE